jgi:hypothetical protein
MPETVNYRQWTGKDIENIKYDDFTGFNGRSIEDCKLNNQEMADKVNKYLDTLKNKTKTKMKTWQETGDFQPERYMDNRKPFIAKKRQAKSKKIYIGINEIGTVTADQMAWKAITAARIYKTLCENDINCEIIIYYSSLINKGLTPLHVSILLKSYNDRLNINKLCAAISPYSFRFFGFIERYKTCKINDLYLSKGMGTTIYTKDTIKKAYNIRPDDIWITSGECLTEKEMNDFIKNIKI